MEIIESLNQRVKKLGFFNIQLVKISNWFFALIVLKLIPEILTIDTKWFVVLLVLFALKPFYVVWLKDEPPGTNERFTKKLSFVDLQLGKVANWFFAARGAVRRGGDGRDVVDHRHRLLPDGVPRSGRHGLLH